MVTVCWESRAEAAHLLSRIELRRCWVVLATQDQYTLIDFYGHTHTHTHTAHITNCIADGTLFINIEGSDCKAVGR